MTRDNTFNSLHARVVHQNSECENIVAQFPEEINAENITIHDSSIEINNANFASCDFETFSGLSVQDTEGKSNIYLTNFAESTCKEVVCANGEATFDKNGLLSTLPLLATNAVIGWAYSGGEGAKHSKGISNVTVVNDKIQLTYESATHNFLLQNGGRLLVLSWYLLASPHELYVTLQNNAMETVTCRKPVNGYLIFLLGVPQNVE